MVQPVEESREKELKFFLTSPYSRNHLILLPDVGGFHHRV